MESLTFGEICRKTALAPARVRYWLGALQIQAAGQVAQVRLYPADTSVRISAAVEAAHPSKVHGQSAPRAR